MIEEVFNFNGLFGKVAPGMCRIDMKGRTAVKTSNGYKAYDLDSQRLVNCTSFCFDLGEDMFFLIPTSSVEVGDIILVNKTPRCVLDVEKKNIKVLNYEDSTIETVVPERHVFMGNTYFYGKIVSIMSGMFANNGDDDGDGDGGEFCGGFGNLLKFKVISSMFKGEGGSAGGMGNMLPMMMLMGGNNGNMFGNMFGGMFGGKRKKHAKTAIPVAEDDADGEDDGKGGDE